VKFVFTLYALHAFFIASQSIKYGWILESIFCLSSSGDLPGFGIGGFFFVIIIR
jgi:hypothetical protein